MILSWIREMVDGIEATAIGVKETLGYARDYARGSGIGSSVTSNYPEVEPTLPKGYRGHLFNNIEKCTGCKSCARACPIDCFAIETEMSEGTKLHISRFDIDLSKCIYCGLCEYACPHDCLHMTRDYRVSPTNSVNTHGRRYLFRRRPDQVGRHLDTQEMAQLHRATESEAAGVSKDDRDFLAGIEDHTKGRCLIGIYGEGFYTPEEKSRVQAIRDEKKRQREAAQRLQEQAQAQAQQAPGAEGGAS